MKLENAVVLITGANRGLGLAFAREAIARGARRIYAAARDPAKIMLPGVVPIRLDVTRPDEIAAAVRSCPDITLLINNAGIATTGGFLAEAAADDALAMMETNFMGPLRLSRAFASTLAANGGGAIINVLSVASWISPRMLGVYGASKAAAWSLTNGLRHALREQNTHVLGLHAGFIDTDLVRDIDAPKATPASVVTAAFDGLAAGKDEVLADEIARQVHRGLSAEPAVYLQPLNRE